MLLSGTRVLLLGCLTSASGELPEFRITRQDGSTQTFERRGLGLDTGFNTSLRCDAREGELRYTPNRAAPDASTANNLVVIAGNRAKGLTDRLGGPRWASFEAVYFARMNRSHVLISIEGADDASHVVGQLHLAPVRCVRPLNAFSESCDHHLKLSRSEEYTVYESKHGRTLIFLHFRPARVPWQFIGADEKMLPLPTRVGAFKSTEQEDIVAYARSTSWYAHFVFIDHAALLAHFDYFMKVDVDVCFGDHNFFAHDHTIDIADARALFLHRGIRDDHPTVVKGLDECIATYADLQASFCGRKVVAATQRTERGAGWLRQPGKCFFGEYNQGWLGFFTSPEVLRYGMFWANFHDGVFQNRWTDQQFFLHAIALFGRVSRGSLLDVSKHYERGAWFHRCTGKCAPLFQPRPNKGSKPC